MKKSKSHNKILIVGQTPPPYGGQANMIKYIINGKYDKIKIYHIRMCFSKEFSERGRFTFYKVFHLFSIILQIYKSRIFNRTSCLYYPISNNPKISVYRDAIILFFTRWLFHKTIYHFHASGISEELPKYNKILQIVLFSIFKNPDLSITSSIHNPDDAKYLNSKKNVIIPLGIPNENKGLQKTYKNKTTTILFVGLLNSTKGELDILSALHILKSKNILMNLQIAGKFESEEYKNIFFETVKKLELQTQVEYLGIIQGESKISCFSKADIFCFPSYFVSESFGIVLLEAMQFSLPIIATKWRGIQSIVEDNINGFLVDIKSPDQIADKLKILTKSQFLIKEMGENSKRLYEEKYTLDVFLNRLEEEFSKL